MSWCLARRCLARLCHVRLRIARQCLVRLCLVRKCLVRLRIARLRIVRQCLVRLCPVLIAASPLLSSSAAAHDGRPLGLRVEQVDAARWTLSVWVPSGRPTPRVRLEGCAPITAKRSPGAVGPELALSSLPSPPSPRGGAMPFLRWRCVDGPEAVRIDFPAASPSMPVVLDVRRRDGLRTRQALAAGQKRIPIAQASSRWGFVRMGIRHIAGGLDHLLFLLLLVFVVRRRNRRVAPLLVVVSGFTVAHALTLTLAVSGVLRLPSAPVEAAIALSIVVLAGELLRGGHATWTLRYPGSVAFGFGLLHGLGFAGSLAEVGVPPEDLAGTLVAFHLGVELGQLAFVGAVAVLLRGAGARVAFAKRSATYAAGLVGSYWLAERVLPMLPP